MTRLALVVALYLAPLLAAVPARAGAGASAWSEHNGAALRLLDAGARADGEHLAGIEVRVPAGFKTYWRSPGDSGVPPVVSTAGSDNIASVEVLHPAPTRFPDGAGGHSWGYASDVVFPLRIRKTDSARPARLAVSMDYAICAKLCIPVQGEATLQLSPGKAPDQTVSAFVEQHLAQVPVRKAPGEPGVVGITGLRAGDTPDRLVIEARVADHTGLELFIEAPSGWFIDAGTPEPAGDGRVTIPALIAERPREAAAGPVHLTVTLVSAAGAIEVNLPLPLR
jgi:DsbC/DsbD-like thiol-disulfide interchange protein